MVINGKELGFKVSKKKDVANFEKAIRDMEEKEQEIQKKDSDLGEVIEALENLFREFFITATGIDVVGECDDIEEMTKMYYTFLKEVEKQKKCFEVPAIPKGKK